MSLRTTANLGTDGSTRRAFGIYIQKLITYSLQPYLRFEQLADIEHVPEGNYYARFIVSNRIATSSVSTITEGTTTNPSPVAWTVTPTELTPTQYGLNVELTDLVVKTAAFSALETGLKECLQALARQIDAAIQTVVNAGSNVIYAGNKTARADLAAGDLMDLNLIIRASQHLRKSGAPEFPDGGFAAVLSAEVANDIKTNSSPGQYQDWVKYNYSNVLFNGEFAMINGVRLLESGNVSTFSSTVTVHPTTVVAYGAFKVFYWEAEKIKTYYQLPETAVSVSNKLGLFGFAGAKTTMAVGRVQEDRIVRIETAATTIL